MPGRDSRLGEAARKGARTRAGSVGPARCLCPAVSSWSGGAATLGPRSLLTLLSILLSPRQLACPSPSSLLLNLLLPSPTPVRSAFHAPPPYCLAGSHCPCPVPSASSPSSLLPYCSIAPLRPRPGASRLHISCPHLVPPPSLAPVPSCDSPESVMLRGKSRHSGVFFPRARVSRSPLPPSTSLSPLGSRGARAGICARILPASHPGTWVGLCALRIQDAPLWVPTFEVLARPPLPSAHCPHVGPWRPAVCCMMARGSPRGSDPGWTHPEEQQLQEQQARPVHGAARSTCPARPPLAAALASGSGRSAGGWGCAPLAVPGS